jgi:hypothetical protein
MTGRGRLLTLPFTRARHGGPRRAAGAAALSRSLGAQEDQTGELGQEPGRLHRPVLPANPFPLGGY